MRRRTAPAADRVRRTTKTTMIDHAADGRGSRTRRTRTRRIGRADASAAVAPEPTPRDGSRPRGSCF
jgi:hypothetical protein